MRLAIYSNFLTWENISHSNRKNVSKPLKTCSFFETRNLKTIYVLNADLSKCLSPAISNLCHALGRVAFSPFPMVRHIGTTLQLSNSCPCVLYYSLMDIKEYLEAVGNNTKSLAPNPDCKDQMIERRGAYLTGWRFGFHDGYQSLLEDIKLFYEGKLPLPYKPDEPHKCIGPANAD